MTTQSAGVDVERVHRLQVGAGSGLRAGTSSPQIVTSKGSSPRSARIDRSTISASRRGVVVTRAVREPRVPDGQQQVGAPPAASSMPAVHQPGGRVLDPAAVGGPLVLGAPDAEVVVEDGHRRPHAGADGRLRGPRPTAPRRDGGRAPAGPRPSSCSVSTSVPSMSNRTAEQCRRGRVRSSDQRSAACS